MVGTVAHRSSVMCREALRCKACTNGVYYTSTRITVCTHTLRGVNRRWHGAKPEAELRQPRTLVGWMALWQGEVCHVALLWCALAYAIWGHVPFCKSAICFIVGASWEFAAHAFTKVTLPCLASCRHRTSSHLSAIRFLGEKEYLVVALCGSGYSALGQL